MTAAARTVWLLFWRPSVVLGPAMDRVAATLREHPYVAALLFVEGFCVGMMAALTWMT